MIWGWKEHSINAALWVGIGSKALPLIRQKLGTEDDKVGLVILAVVYSYATDIITPKLPAFLFYG
jgi:hypothetical protein